MSRPFSLFFDEDFDTMIKKFMNGDGAKYVSYNFPPVDVLIDKDKNLFFYFALAGYEKDNIRISFSGDAMIVDIEAKERKLEEGLVYLNKGIRNSKCVNKYYVPRQRYNIDEAKSVFEDGMLKIEVPSKTPEKKRFLKIE